MYPVLDPEPAVAGVELEVVEVVELGGEGEWEVVAGVVVHHLQTADRVEYSNILFVNCFLWIIRRLSGCGMDIHHSELVRRLL